MVVPIILLSPDLGAEGLQAGKSRISFQVNHLHSPLESSNQRDILGVLHHSDLRVAGVIGRHNIRDSITDILFVAVCRRHQVVHLKRVQFGPVILGDLPSGMWRKLTEEEIRALFEENGRA